jgi:hypothetical protein
LSLLSHLICRNNSLLNFEREFVCIIKLDLIDRDIGESLTDNIALHEEVIGYLLDVEEE